MSWCHPQSDYINIIVTSGLYYCSRHPHKALQDYSTSLLLDNSVTNVMAYLHRGILYTSMKWYVHKLWYSSTTILTVWLILYFSNALYFTKIIFFLHHCSYSDAIPDFEAAIKLDNTVACFHVCLGLTYLLYSKQYQRYVTALTCCLNIPHIKQYIISTCMFVS